MALFDENDAGGIAASSRWLRSVSDDTTGQPQDQRSCTPAGVPAAFLIACISGGVAALVTAQTIDIKTDHRKNWAEEILSHLPRIFNIAISPALAEHRHKPKVYR